MHYSSITRAMNYSKPANKSQHHVHVPVCAYVCERVNVHLMNVPYICKASAEMSYYTVRCSDHIWILSNMILKEFISFERHFSFLVVLIHEIFKVEALFTSTVPCLNIYSTMVLIAFHSHVPLENITGIPCFYTFTVVGLWYSGWSKNKQTNKKTWCCLVHVQNNKTWH